MESRPGAGQPFHSNVPAGSGRAGPQSRARRKPGRVQPASFRARRSGVGGAVAQSGERLICNQEVVGSTPISSTKGSGGSRAGGL